MRNSIRPLRSRFNIVMALCSGALASIFTVTAHSDTLFVTNYLGDNIEQFDSSGNGKFFAGTDLNPIGITADKSGNLYVATDYYTTYAVDKYTASGSSSAFISHTDASLYGPKGLTFDSQGNLYVSNTLAAGAANITKYNSSGGHPVTIASDFDQPFGMAFDSIGNLYVAEYGYGKIYKIAPNGVETLFATPSLGGGTYGIAVDSAGNVYASSNYYGDGWIQEYTSNGVNIGIVYGTSSTFSGPSGMTFDSAGNLFVAASTSNSIEEFAHGNLSAGTRFDISGTLDAPDFLTFAPGSSDAWATPEPGSLVLLCGLSLTSISVMRRRKIIGFVRCPRS